MATLFEVTYESNNLNEHDRIYSDGGRMGTSVASALGGSTYGCEYETDGATVVVYGENTFVLATGGYSIYFRLDPNSIVMGNGDVFTLSRTIDIGTGDDFLRIDLRYDGASYEIGLTAYTDAGGTSATAYYNITDAEHEIEGIVNRSSSATDNNGLAELFIDGVSQEVVSGIDNFDLFPLVDTHRIGMATGLDATTDGIIYIDGIIADDAPVPPSPPSPPPSAASGYLGLAQKRPSELIDLIRPDVQMRAEPNFAWKSVEAQFMSLPGLRAFWPMSSVDYTTANRCIDVSGHGYHLTDSNTVTFGYDNLSPYAGFVSASSQALIRADGGAANWADITGTESYIVSGQRGLTIGGWFYFTDTASILEYCMSKSREAGNWAYILRRSATGEGQFLVSDGVTELVASSSVVMASETWYFLVGRFIPSTTIAVWVNGTQSSVSASAVASIQDEIANFYISGRHAAVPDYFLNGRASMCFLCAAAASDAIVGAAFEQSRVMFNVL